MRRPFQALGILFTIVLSTYHSRAFFNTFNRTDGKTNDVHDERFQNPTGLSAFDAHPLIAEPIQVFNTTVDWMFNTTDIPFASTTDEEPSWIETPRVCEIDAKCSVGWLPLKPSQVDDSNCWSVSRDVGTFWNARHLCAIEESFLAVLDDVESNKIIMDFLKTQPSKEFDIDLPAVWVGLYGAGRLSDMTWLETETTVNYTNWSTGTLGNFHCVAATERGWVTKNCKTSLHFVCQRKEEVLPKPEAPKLYINGQRPYPVTPLHSTINPTCVVNGPAAYDPTWVFYASDGSIEVTTPGEIMATKSAFSRDHYTSACTTSASTSFEVEEYFVDLEIACFTEPIPGSFYCSHEFKACDSVRLLVVPETPSPPEMNIETSGQLTLGRSFTVNCTVPIHNTLRTLVTWAIHKRYDITLVDGNQVEYGVRVIETRYPDKVSSQLTINSVTFEISLATVKCYSYNVTTFGTEPCGNDARLCSSTYPLLVKRPFSREKELGWMFWTVSGTVLILTVLLLFLCRRTAPPNFTSGELHMPESRGFLR